MAQVDDLKRRITDALAVPDNAYQQRGAIRYVIPRDPRVVLMEIREALTRDTGGSDTHE